MAGPGPLRPANIDSSNETPANGDLATLRELLLGPERALLERLQERIHSRSQRAADVGEVLPDAILLRGTKDPQLRRALQPLFEEGLRSSIRKDPKILADVLFPMVGRAVRQAVASALQGMVESLNQIIETSFSFRSIGWRLEAARTGKSYGEIALLRSLLYRVDQVFLIENETGLVMQHLIGTSAVARDPEMVSAMLTAIQNFVQDSFGATDAPLETVRLHEFDICVQHGPRASLAAVILGTPPSAISSVFSSALEEIHGRFGEQLESFGGEAARLDGTRPILQRCLLGQSPGGRRRAPAILYVVGVAAIVALIVWAGISIRSSLRWNRYLDALRHEQGIVITEQSRNGTRYSIEGLRDPLARDPASLLAATGIPPANVSSRWEPYLSLLPRFIALREIPALRASLEQQHIYFDTGRSTLTPTGLESVRTLAGMLAQFRKAASAAGETPRFELIGHTDDEGSPDKNMQLGLDRALAVKAALGADLSAISVRSAGAKEPLHPSQPGRPQPLNRSVGIRVIQPENH